jgi:hypothetical protein
LASNGFHGFLLWFIVIPPILAGWRVAGSIDMTAGKIIQKRGPLQFGQLGLPLSIGDLLPCPFRRLSAMFHLWYMILWPFQAIHGRRHRFFVSPQIHSLTSPYVTSYYFIRHIITACKL